MFSPLREYLEKERGLRHSAEAEEEANTADALDQEDEHDYALGRLAAITFFLVVLTISLGIAFDGIARPLDKSASSTLIEKVAGATAQPTPEPTPTPRLGPRTAGVVNLYMGPSEDYDVVGLLPAGADLEIVGRDTSGEWIAISVSPGSPFYGWMPVSKARGLPQLDSLKVAPVTLLPSNTRR
jgi:hypothetical protein